MSSIQACLGSDSPGFEACMAYGASEGVRINGQLRRQGFRVGSACALQHAGQRHAQPQLERGYLDTGFRDCASPGRPCECYF